jgi:hypothetical protein
MDTICQFLKRTGKSELAGGGGAKIKTNKYVAGH